MQNPCVKSGDPCGSSSGSAISVAASMVAVSLGTETDGSIICPADHNSVVGIKPTVGLTSRALSPRQDTIGTVSDAVYVLDAIVGYDPRDHEATKAAAKFIPEVNIHIINDANQSGEGISLTTEFKEMMKKCGQEQLIEAQMTNGIGENVLKAVETMKKLSDDGFEKLMNENELDAMVTIYKKIDFSLLGF
ncbi:Amidase [Trema orientale]|uniref:Amidase n=1 Tax=Trema orientale TaxID=63057 RepID=A0A2P5ED15_TREOI|nr:Amidase [Trema orientale]